MPIKIPDALPARATLESENIFVMTENRAIHQDIRPLKIMILNLMPTKIATETQLLRALSNSPLQVEVEFLQTSTYTSKNTPQSHLSAFYTTFENIQPQKYDGMIITGAPVEDMEFSSVDYWNELCEILEWTKTSVCSTLHICWGAQAGLYYHYGIEKHALADKKFGIFSHRLLSKSEPLFRGFDDRFDAPHSRHTEIREQDILSCPSLRLLSVSDDAGVYIVAGAGGRQIFVTGHSEYDADTLDTEYKRDLSRGLAIKMPENYYKNNDADSPPEITWRAHSNLLFSNWLNYYVYQNTPYNLETL